MDPFLRWLEALDQRHFSALSFQEVRRAVQSLSSLYVERRSRLKDGSALDGAGKRAAFATFFAPLHFLIVREVVRALKAAGSVSSTPRLLDLGCGTGCAGAACALEWDAVSSIAGIDRSPWAVQEARWTYGAFGLRGMTKAADINTLVIPEGTAVVAAFAINELNDEGREFWRRQLLKSASRGCSSLVIEPIARRAASWWDEWAGQWIDAGGRADAWRFPVVLPERLSLMDKAAGLDHRELTARSLWLPSGLAGRQGEPS